MDQVLASAIVDVIKPATAMAIGNYRVEAWGQPPYDYVRIYEIMAKSNTVAAQEGIQRFVKEMEAMGTPKE